MLIFVLSGSKIKELTSSRAHHVTSSEPTTISLCYSWLQAKGAFVIELCIHNKAADVLVLDVALITVQSVDPFQLIITTEII